ncbi:TetR/AcrR family transcriptional regulator [Microbulbifer sp. ANSA001]|uniref:TetR/AcrR family transcriptional regulator n=1 Tax=Microbulbifer sp. ANSA001 TaxID=3243358 RepID=UPI00404270CF
MSQKRVAMNTNDSRVSCSRARLIEAGKELLMKNPKASLKEVAEVAGVGRATLYRHFETREELILEIARECFKLTSQVLRPIYTDCKLSAREKVRRGLEALMPLADSYHFLLSLWNIAEGDLEVLAYYGQQLDDLTSLIEQAQKDGDIRKDLSIEWISSMIDAQVYSAWWLIGQGQASVEQAAGFAVTSLFEGINA